MAEEAVAAPPLVVAEGIERRYAIGDETVSALRGVDLTIGAGEVHLITGPSGSGKSTLVYLLGALERPTAGTIRIDGEDLATLSERALADLRRERIGFVFQSMNLLPVLSAMENVLLPTVPRGRAPELRERARALLSDVGLGHRLDHPAERLSGGEQQRVAVARALLNRPRLILADEPTGELDSQTGTQVMALMRRLAGEWGATLVIVTHDLTIRQRGDHEHRILDGRIDETDCAD